MSLQLPIFSSQGFCPLCFVDTVFRSQQVSLHIRATTIQNRRKRSTEAPASPKKHLERHFCRRFWRRNCEQKMLQERIGNYFCCRACTTPGYDITKRTRPKYSYVIWGAAVATLHNYQDMNSPTMILHNWRLKRPQTLPC